MTAPRPPGPKGWEALPHTLAFLQEQVPYIQRMAAEYGDVVQFQLGLFDNILVSDPKLIHEVLVSKADDYHKDIITHELSELLGQGLLTAEGEHWRRNRKLASPNLQRTQVAGYADTMSEYTARHMDEWKHGEVRELHHDMMQLTMEIVVKTLFNLDPSSELVEVGHHVDVGMHYFHLMIHSLWRFAPKFVPMPARYDFQDSLRRLDTIVYDLISQRRNADEGDDLLFRLIRAKDDEGHSMTDEQLRDEVLTMFLAGHETTALVATYTWLLLMQDREVARAMFAEVDDMLGTRRATCDDLAKLPYVTAVIKESMRLYPPAWIIGRQAIRDTTLGPYPVKKSTQILISQMVLHRKPEYFPDPDAFKPERWLEPGFEKSLPKHIYLPFGGGPRICIGNHFAMMEAVLIIATMAQSVDLELRMSEELRVQPAVTMRPVVPIHVRVHRR